MVLNSFGICGTYTTQLVYVAQVDFSLDHQGNSLEEVKIFQFSVQLLFLFSQSAELIWMNLTKYWWLEHINYFRDLSAFCFVTGNIAWYPLKCFLSTHLGLTVSP